MYPCSSFTFVVVTDCNLKAAVAKVYSLLKVLLATKRFRYRRTPSMKEVLQINGCNQLSRIT